MNDGHLRFLPYSPIWHGILPPGCCDLVIRAPLTYKKEAVRQDDLFFGADSGTRYSTEATSF